MLLLKHGVRLQRESFTKIRDELPKLFAEHYWEVAHDKSIRLEPDFELYEKLDFMGQTRIFTVRSYDEGVTGKLIGYAFFFVRANIHYKSSIQAVQDLIFITKERRGFGREFIEWCDKELRGEGVHVVQHHVKAEHNWGPMLERMGYQLVDLIYVRKL